MNALQNIEIQDMEDIMFNTPEEELKERFRVTDLSGADWCLRKISAAETKKAELKELARQEIQRIENWMNTEVNKLEEGRGFFEGLLTEYLLDQREIDPKFKISTPHGKVSTRKQQPKWEYDNTKVLQYLKETDQSEYIRIKEEVEKAKLKKDVKVIDGRVVDSNGMIVEGITVTDQPEKIVIKVVD